MASIASRLAMSRKTPDPFSSAVELKFEPMPPFIIRKLAAGGMLPLRKAEVEAGRIPRRIA
jgi:hypothetical protein